MPNDADAVKKTRSPRGLGTFENHPTKEGWRRGVKVIDGRKHRTTWLPTLASARDALGRINRESVAAADAVKEEARLARIAAGAMPVSPTRTVRHAIDSFNRQKPLTARTLGGYEYYRDHYLKPMLDFPVETVTRLQCREFYQTLADKGYSKSTVHQAAAVLRNGLGWAHDNAWCSDNEAAGIKLPTAPVKKIKGLPDKKRLALEKAMEGTRYESRFLLALRYASRPGELTGLRWSYVNFEDGSITIAGQLQNMILKIDGVSLGPVYVSHVKTAAGARTYWPDKRIMQLLAEWKVVQDAEKVVLAKKPVSAYRIQVQAGRAERLARMKELKKVDDVEDYHLVPDDMVWTQENGEPLLPRWDTELWGKLCKAAKVPAVRLYAARHTAITHLLDEGESVLSVSLLAGHRSETFTQMRYGTETKVPNHLSASFDKRDKRDKPA